MRKLLFLLLLCPLHAFAQPIGNVPGSYANQNVQDKGIRTVDGVLITSILDTAQVNLLLARLPTGSRKPGALGRVGSTLYWYYPNKWNPISSGSGGSMDYAYVDSIAANAVQIAKSYADSIVSAGGGSDGNNYTASTSFNAGTGVLTTARIGLTSLTVSLDGRYLLTGQAIPISQVTGLWAALAANAPDGNNYLTGASFTGGNLILQRNGLSDLNVGIDGRYSLLGHTHLISGVLGLTDTINSINARIAGGGTAYTGSNGVQVSGTVISLTGTSFTGSDRTKLDGIASGATANTGTLTNLTATNGTGQTWTITNPTTTPNISLALTSSAVGLGNVTNTSDANKPVSTAQQTALNGKVNYTDTASFLSPYARFASVYDKTASDARYLQTESDPVWNSQKVLYPTLTYANANYAPASASYLYGTNDFGQIPVGTGTNTLAGSNTFTRIGGMVTNYGNFYVADSSKGYGFNVAGTDSIVYLKIDPSGQFIRQFVDGGTGDTSSSSAIGVDPSQIVTLTGAQTLTNKILTSPVINSPTGIVQANIPNLVSDIAGKQPQLSGTGFVKFSGTTPSYDNSTYYLASNPNGYTTNTGTVTSASVTTANGVSASVATATTTPAFTFTLNAITPSSVTSAGSVTGSNLSGTNTGDQTITLSGDVTGSGTGAITTAIGTGVIVNADVNASAAIDATKLGTGTVNNTELGYVDGVTSAIQTQINGKQASGSYATLAGAEALTNKSVNGVTLTNAGSATSYLNASGGYSTPAGGGGGGTIASTSLVLKGDNAGNAIAATAGTDYVIPSGSVASATTAATATAANGLNSATTTVVVNAATAPTTGQVLTATSPTAAAWQSPSGGTLDTAYLNSAYPRMATSNRSLTPIISAGGISMVGFSTLSGSGGTVSYGSPSSTDALTERPRYIRTATGTGNTLGGVIQEGSSSGIMRGNYDMYDGAISYFRGGWPVYNSGERLGSGLYSTGNQNTTDPSSFVNCLLFAKDVADANIQIMYNDASGTCTKVDTGIPADGSSIYDCIVTIPAGQSTSVIFKLIRRNKTNGISTFTHTATTNLPVAGTQLFMIHYSANANTGVATSVALVQYNLYN